MASLIKLRLIFQELFEMDWNESGGDQDPWGRRSRGPSGSGGSGKNKSGGIMGIFRGGGSSGVSAGLLIAIIFVIVVAYFALGLTQFDQSQRGVVLRFGKLQEALLQPGLRWRPPIIDKVTKVNVTRVDSHQHKALMLTEDENIVDVTLTVQYLVGDPKSYVTEIFDPQVALEHATESALRHVVGGSSMDQVITEGRAEVAVQVQDRLQTYLDRYQSGLRVVKVNIDTSGPPSQVQEAFDDVQKAKEDEVRVMNEANTYAQKVVPEARGDAQKQLEEANAYRDQVVSRAQGEAERFRKLLAEYQLAKNVTRDRLYIDAMESVLSNSTKVLVDVDDSNNVLFLPLDQLTAAAVARERQSDAENMQRNDSLASNLNRNGSDSSAFTDRARR